MCRVNIITGAVNSGKTTKLIDIFNNIGRGDGFFNRKIYMDNHYVGQELVEMQSGIKKLWSSREMEFGKGKEVFCYKNYSFYEEGLEFAENIITLILESGIEPIYIDEIGPIELQEKGFHKLFKECIESGKELYVVVRESCVNHVIEKYGIERYNLIYSTIKL